MTELLVCQLSVRTPLRIFNIETFPQRCSIKWLSLQTKKLCSYWIRRFQHHLHEISSLGSTGLPNYFNSCRFYILTHSKSYILLGISVELPVNTVELHLSGLIGTASHTDMQKIRIIGFYFENRLHWPFEFRLLLFTVCTCVCTFRPSLILSSISHNTVLCLIR